jgi:hypothetical protein
MLHYDMVYPYPSHLDMAASFGSVAVGVGGGGQQLQQRVVQGLSWFMAGFKVGRDNLGGWFGPNGVGGVRRIRYLLPSSIYGDNYIAKELCKADISPAVRPRLYAKNEEIAAFQTPL